jgi:hypothetical protein
MMQCTIRVTIVAVLGALVLAWPAAASTNDFAADVHDNLACTAGFDFCGKGLVHGFGTATTTLVFTGFAPGPGDCATATAVRVLTLTSDGSTLVLELAGTICEQKLAGTFTISGGTGVFAGASGSGTLWGTGTGVPVPSDTVHFRGTIALL